MKLNYQTNKAGLWIGLGIAIPLTIFTMWRSTDLLINLLPTGQALAGIFGVAAFDGGLIGWTFGFMKAKGSDQRLYAGILIGLDFLAVGTALVFDIVLSVSRKGIFQIDLTTLFVAAIILVAFAVLINVLGGILYALADPKKKQEMRDQRAHDRINDLADQHIEKNAAMYAPQFAQVKVTQWLHQAAMEHGVHGHVTLPGLPAGPVIDSTAQVQQTGPLPVVHQPPQQNGGLLGTIRQKLVGNQQPPVDVADLQRQLAHLQQQVQQNSTNVPSQEPTTSPLAESVAMSQEAPLPKEHPYIQEVRDEIKRTGAQANGNGAKPTQERN